MTDNSTQQTETTTTENAPVMTVQEMHRLKVRIDKLNINWTDEHNNEMRRLGTWLNNALNEIEKISLPPTRKDAINAGTFLATWVPSFSPDWIVTRKGEHISSIPIKIITAFRKDFAHVIDDRGAQTSLFDEKPSHKLTKTQEKLWGNYYELHPDARRYWLLVIGSFLNNVLLDINEKLAKETPSQKYVATYEASNYYAIMTSPIAQKIADISSRTPKAIDEISGNIKLIPANDVIVILETGRYNNAEITPSSQKLLDYIRFRFTQQNEYKRFDTDEEYRNYMPNTSVRFSIREYLEAQNKKTTKENIKTERERTDKDLKSIFSMFIEGKTARGDIARCYVCSSQAIIRGNIIFNFTPEYARTLVSAFVNYWPKWIFAIDGRKYALYRVASYLATHYSIDKNRVNNRHNIIRAKSILCGCSIFALKQTRYAKRDGINRLEPILDELSEFAREHGGGFLWHFCTAHGEPLTDEQCKDVTNIPDWESDLYIQYEFEDYPDQTQRLERRAKERTDKENRKRAAIARNAARKEQHAKAGTNN